MHNVKKTKVVSAALISLLLSACGGGSSSPLDPPKNPSSGGSVSSGTVDTTVPVDIGRGDGSTFVSGEIDSSYTGELIPAGGSTGLTVSIVSSTNTLVTSPIQVTFNSRCFAAGEATLTVGDTATNKVSTENGQASITYTANGCVGEDEITATASLNGGSKTARKTLTIAQDTIQSIQFKEAVPDKIFLKDSGGAQTSVIRFSVLGSTGAPIKNVPINFTLSTDVGGIQLTNTTATTDKSGLASTTIQAGSIPTAVEVIATEPNSNISGRSNKLSIGTGMPDQNSMSISASKFNPPGWNRDGEEVSITVRLADAFNNPPPDNTSVQFTTEGGVIDANCVTLNGSCSVKWKSQATRPSNGRVTILATTLGNESFGDKDGDGLYTPGVDIFNSYNAPGNGNCDPNVPVSTSESNGNDAPCDDLGEAYLDKNENGKYDEGEEFVDLNRDKKRTIENGEYNGVLCATPGQGCSKQAVNIRQDLVLVMSSDMPYSENGLLIGQPEVIEMGADESYSFNVTLADINGNSMPLGTTVSLITQSASDVTISHSLPSAGIANTLYPTVFTVTLKSSKTERPSGNFSISVKSPYLEQSFMTRIVPKPLGNTSARFIGKGTGADFRSGEIEVGIGNAVLSPAGTTSLAVNLVDGEGKLTAGAATVTFSSPCYVNGKAKFTNAAGTETNSITTQNGRATIFYNLHGCTGSDEITATADLSTLLDNTATTTITIVEASAQNIRFESALPAQISLKGAQGEEISTVSFIVNGVNGLGMPGVPVTLELNNTIGGVCIVNASGCTASIQAVSDGNGRVSARVQSGTIATSVRVTATAQDGQGQSISTQSSKLVISTGLPDQDSMSIAASEFNPPAYINGYEVDVTVRMADAFNNPVPEGTSVTFTASAGLIGASCETNEFSACTVKWVTSNPPANGKVKILATALGNESFIDSNGNGLYDAGDIFAANNPECDANAPIPSAAKAPTACDDLGEAYLDTNFNNLYDLGEIFVDIFGADSSLVKDGARTPGNGKYDGALCPVGSTICTRNSVTVRQDLTLVMSTGIPLTNGDGKLIGQPGTISLGTSGTPQPITIILQDTKGNSMPAGTKITIDTSKLVNAEATINPDPVEVPSNVTGPTEAVITLYGTPGLNASGSLQVIVEVPDKGSVIGSKRSYTTIVN